MEERRCHLKGKVFLSIPLSLSRGGKHLNMSVDSGKEVDDKRRWLLTLGISEELGIDGFKSIAEEISLPRNGLFLRPKKGQYRQIQVGEGVGCITLNFAFSVEIKVSF